jgi:hypothetical protein
VHLDGRAVGRLGQPEVEILALAGLEEHDIVAVVEVGELVELRELGLGVEFGVFARVRKKGVEVVKQVTVSGVMALVLLLFRLELIFFRRIPHCNTS